jgi:acylphosphatase
VCCVCFGGAFSADNAKVLLAIKKVDAKVEQVLHGAIWSDNASSRSRQNQQDFEGRVKKYYKTDYCMLLGKEFVPTKKNTLSAAHLLPFRHRSKLPTFNLQRRDIWNTRNGLLLAKPIEEQYDKQRVCFVVEALTNPPKYRVKVLDPRLKGEKQPIPGSRVLWKALDGLPLKLPEGRLPFARIIGAHLQSSLQNARDEGWIDAAEEKKQIRYASISISSEERDETSEDEEEEEHFHVVVEGDVQRVGFRDAVVDDANKLGLTGWVRNLRGGGVEIRVNGAAVHWKTLVRHLHELFNIQTVTEQASGDDKFSNFVVRDTT